MVIESFLNTLHNQLNLQHGLHEEFIRGFTHNCIAMLTVFFLSALFSPLIWGNLEKDKRPLWHTTMVAAFNPYAIVYFSYPEIKAMWNWMFNHPSGLSALSLALSDNPEHSFYNYKATPACFYFTGLTCGYMFLDMIAMVIWAKPLIKVQRLALYQQIWGHHLFSCVLWPLALCMDKTVILVAYYNFTEITNPFLNIRWLLDNRPNAPKWASVGCNYILSATLVIVFFIVRIIPVPFFFLHLILPWKYVDCTILQILIVVVTCPIPFMLNMFWFSLMYRKAKRQVKELLFGTQAPKKEDTPIKKNK